MPLRGSLNDAALEAHPVLPSAALLPAAAATPPSTGRSWADVQAQLRKDAKATPRSGSRSREGTLGASPVVTRVVRIKPLE
jgi:hypothetical protein